MKTNKKSAEITGKKPIKLSGPQQVVDFLNNLEHPLNKEIEEVRKIILSTNESISEHIKWNAPSFCFDNEDRVTFNLQGKGFFRLVFHCGAKVKDQAGDGTLFEDTTGLLDWVTTDRAMIKITDMSDVESKKEKLAAVVAKWIEVTCSK
jgi:hypothetical protein